MKRERRHELQHNELADWLAKAIERLKPYQNVIVAAVVVVILAAGGYAWISHASEAKTAQAWDALNSGLESGNPGSFTRVMDDYPNTNVADVAAVVSADLRLADGCDRLFHDKAVAEQQLSQAIELYGKELEQGGNPSLRQRATFGLGRAWEAKGDLDKATRRYQEVVAQLARRGLRRRGPRAAGRPEAAHRQAVVRRPPQVQPEAGRLARVRVAGRDAQFRPRGPAQQSARRRQGHQFRGPRREGQGEAEEQGNRKAQGEGQGRKKIAAPRRHGVRSGAELRWISTLCVVRTIRASSFFVISPFVLRHFPNVSFF